MLYYNILEQLKLYNGPLHVEAPFLSLSLFSRPAPNSNMAAGSRAPVYLAAFLDHLARRVGICIMINWLWLPFDVPF